LRATLADAVVSRAAEEYLMATREDSMRVVGDLLAGREGLKAFKRDAEEAEEGPMAAEEFTKAVEEGLKAAVEWSKACGVVSKSAKEGLNSSREGLMAPER
jgi:hypothetical protein